MGLAAALKLLAWASREQLVVPRTGDVSDGNDGSPPPCIVLPKHVARRNPSYYQQRHEMEGRSQPQQRRSRVARLATEQRSKPSSRRTGHRQRGSAFQQQADVDPPKEEYPTLPAERRFDDDVIQQTALPDASSELASSALLATAADLQSRQREVAALAEMFPTEPIERLQDVLLRSGSLHAAAAQLLSVNGADPGVACAPLELGRTETEMEPEGLPWLLSLFADQMSAATVRHVFSCAAGDFDAALDTLGELVTAAESAALSVEQYLKLLAEQASDATAAAATAAREEQASEDYAQRLLSADRAEDGRQSLLGKVALTAPTVARQRAAARAPPPSHSREPRSLRAGPAKQLYTDEDEEVVQLDLHGQSVESGLLTLEAELRRMEQLEPLRNGRRRRLLTVTGRGSHSAGPAGRAPLRTAVERYLCGAGLAFTEQHGGGAFEIRV